MERWKRNAENPSESELNQKRRKGSAGARSSGSALTHVDRRLGRRDDSILDFEKFAKAHDDFWKECEGCYIFGQQTFEVNIAQSVLARDEYIIRKLQIEIVKSVKAQLV